MSNASDLAIVKHSCLAFLGNVQLKMVRFSSRWAPKYLIEWDLTIKSPGTFRYSTRHFLS